ncbi:hypothetical protein GCM10017744_102510 [Streptomyces antimycoticus]|uniref:Uncharacterized protein n=2 Tax=Streptomyces TaxID=1883 RepID=A0A4D4KM69_9ACTN|nr:hypothetical protein [Streptomyces antimycoticus]GDY49284.1 hypothetical protein SANT12839_101660 [Streptomyces antimycoticus]
MNLNYERHNITRSEDLPFAGDATTADVVYAINLLTSLGREVNAPLISPDARLVQYVQLGDVSRWLVDAADALHGDLAGEGDEDSVEAVAEYLATEQEARDAERSKASVSSTPQA